MKIKTGLSKTKPLKKTLGGAIQKKKFSKPTSGVFRNIVKITDAFEELKSGNELTGICCSKEPKPVKNMTAKFPKETTKSNVSKKSIDINKNDKKVSVTLKQKKLKKKTVDGVQKVSKILEYNPTTEVTTNGGEPKLDINKVNFTCV